MSTFKNLRSRGRLSEADIDATIREIRRALLDADLQRPNAVTQLQVVGERAGVPVFAPHPGVQETPDGLAAPPGDPVAVARAGVAAARDRQYDVVIVDTAGRLGVDAEMMRQAVDIRDAVDPDEILFVVDAMIGQDAVT